MASVVAVTGLGHAAHLESERRSEFFDREIISSSDVHLAAGGPVRGAEPEEREPRIGFEPERGKFDYLSIQILLFISSTISVHQQCHN